MTYNSPKMFHPIVFLNTLGKLIEKVIGKRLQYQSITSNFAHFYQLGSLKQCSTIDADALLTHLIHSGWVKSLQTSILAFDITQFFLLLNHQLLPLTLDKAGFDSKILTFFSNYLIGKKTQYLWTGFYSLFFSVDIGVGQGSASYSFCSLYFTHFSYF